MRRLLAILAACVVVALVMLGARGCKSADERQREAQKARAEEIAKHPDQVKARVEQTLEKIQNDPNLTPEQKAMMMARTQALFGKYLDQPGSTP